MEIYKKVISSKSYDEALLLIGKFVNIKYLDTMSKLERMVK